jgi:hypothetical protein
MMSGAVGVHPIVVLASVVIGGKIAGVAGAIFGIPIAAVLSVFFFHWFGRSRENGTVTDRATETPGPTRGPRRQAAARARSRAWTRTSTRSRAPGHPRRASRPPSAAPGAAPGRRSVSPERKRPTPANSRR